ncbi:MAG: hypothetical protein Q4D02_01900 [Clostridia bacterium]|nr:hypothetical protein [Clostridia bacterium]
MNEEDLKNIEQVKEILKIRKEQKEIIENAGGSCINCDPDIKALEGVLNLVERLKRDNRRLDRENQKLFEDIIQNYIPKEKIRKIIERNQRAIADSGDGDLIHDLRRENKILKELLEE